MAEVVADMSVLMTAFTSWITDIIQVFFNEPILLCMFFMPLIVYLIYTVINIIKSIGR